jgi:hypothetical protein
LENGIPKYERMHIYADLVAERRGRTVLETNTKGLKANLVRTGLEDDVKINFLGFNQNKDTYDNGNFTTRYYDGSVSEGTQHDSFGITKIKTLINSSYIPQIDIEFTDVRGLAFFNRENSPYRILFDFPPPIFYLTIKGYYGKALQYQMHLVKYTTDFNSDTGNYVINAKFIAITYAPLTDVLFKYVLNFGLVRKDNAFSVTLDNTRPTTTFELIQKLKVLYDNIKDQIKDDENSVSYDNAIEVQRRVDDAILFLNNYQSTLTEINDSFRPVLFTYETAEGEDFGNIQVISGLGEYDTIIKSRRKAGISSNISTKLNVGFIDLTTFFAGPRSGNIAETNDEEQIAVLNSYRTTLKDKTNKAIGENLIEETDIGEPVEIESREYYGKINDLIPPRYDYALSKKVDENSTIRVSYISIDITDYYLKLFNRKLDANEQRNIAAENINEQINSLVLEKLGMLPTIYNVFEIILNDVDHFFKKMRETSILAEQHHEKFKNEILSGSGNDFGDFREKLYPFPLVLKEERNCGVIKKVKTAPVNLSDKLQEPFPELVLLDEFIDSFSLYNSIVSLTNARSEKDETGNIKWLPCNPTDTNLVNTSQASPYAGIDNPLSSINTSTDNLFDQFLKIFLNRFYIISQNTLRRNFYAQREFDEYVVFRNLHEEMEAINFANGVISKDLGNYFLERSKQFQRNVQSFYDYLSTNNTYNDIYSFSGVIDNLSVTNGIRLYVDRENDFYRGLSIENGDIALRTQNEAGNNPIDEFMTKNVDSLWKKSPVKGNYKWTESNLIYFSDGGSTVKGNYSLETKYVVRNYSAGDNFKRPFRNSINNGAYWSWEKNRKGDINIDFTRDLSESTSNPAFAPNPSANPVDITRGEILETIEEFGHDGLRRYAGIPDFSFRYNIDLANDIVLPWTVSLTKFGDYVVNLDTYGDGSRDNVENRFIRSVMYLSSFGWALSPFSKFPYDFNGGIYTIPAANEVPRFLLAYMGALVDIEGTENYNNLLEFLTSDVEEVTLNRGYDVEESKIIDSCGFLILADIRDINRYLSRRDKDLLKREYNDFMFNAFNPVDDEVLNIYNRVVDNDSCDAEKRRENRDKLLQQSCRAKLFDEELRDSDNIFRLLMARKTLVNFNEITFNTRDEDREEYFSIADVNNGTFGSETNIKSINDGFFRNFFNRLSEELEKKIDDLEETERTFRRNVDDNDILTQTYYSFKNINDKWLAGLNTNTQGYPFNTPRTDGKISRLINQFVFVDRAFNPIGDTIIDLKPLLDLENDTKTSIFTVLTQLLSVNGFEFFPLQNFMSFEDNEWVKSFEIDNGPIEKQFPTFVCMYIGGSSSYPTGIGNDFEEDGIVNLNNPGVADFNSAGCDPDPDSDNQQETANENFRFAQVKAFKVKFGEQNQSMFRDIKIDSKEYPETNESIQILSSIAGDGADQPPVPKGQNLYNLYENRSYKATVQGFGNAMIQPTQYFQLENVPLFNGAYVILEVEHNIVPNKMTTSFSGTKLLKYPLPRVTDPATLFGFKGGSSDVTQPNFNTITEGAGVSENPKEAKYNEFYFLKI